MPPATKTGLWSAGSPDLPLWSVVAHAVGDTSVASVDLSRLDGASVDGAIVDSVGVVGDPSVVSAGGGVGGVGGPVELGDGEGEGLDLIIKDAGLTLRRGPR